jgi:nucleotide-binding universal stress UspA family protein
VGSREQGRILLAVDGEPHTEEAVRWALDLAIGLGMKLNPVHVRDPYLKQFYNDIYAQGREEYLEHVQECLERKARQASEAFEAAARARLERKGHRGDPSWSFDVLDGDPAKQLSGLIDRGGFSMVVLGRRRGKRVAALRTRDLAERLSSVGCAVPMLVVPGPEDPPSGRNAR